jgi:hypothetical protein
MESRPLSFLRAVGELIRHCDVTPEVEELAMSSSSKKTSSRLTFNCSAEGLDLSRATLNLILPGLIRSVSFVDTYRDGTLNSQEARWKRGTQVISSTKAESSPRACM